jgi:phospholipid/cholesterol/gamma-HCH transport system ATP-binding protein
MPDFLLRAEGVHKRFGDLVVLAGADLDVPRGSIVTVLGRSGTGKSVFLKCLAGVLAPEAGNVCFDGQTLDAATRAAFRRRCGYLFQNNALFDSLTALENVALPLEQTTDLPDREVRERALEALRQLGLETHRDRHPGELSGGMQKRLALARAIVSRPELVLFDEPTAGLDPLRRNDVFTMIAKYQRQFGFTAVIVTHDVAEALVVSDRVALLDNGRMRFEGTPAEFSASADPVVRGFRDSAAALGDTVSALRRGETAPSDDPLELLVGAFVFAGLAAVGWLTVKLGGRNFVGGDTYAIEARFDNAGGLNAGANVVVAGVPVGRVEAIRVDETDFSAIATLRVLEGLRLPSDSMASIKTSGLIGDKFVALSPGAEETFLEPGARITLTESSVDLESLIGKMAFGSLDKEPAP